MSQELNLTEGDRRGGEMGGEMGRGEGVRGMEKGDGVTSEIAVT
jgi:hypothetical protein